MTDQHSLASLGIIVEVRNHCTTAYAKHIPHPHHRSKQPSKRTSKGLVRNQVRRRVLGLELRGVLAQSQGIRLGKVVAPSGGKEGTAGA